MDREQGRLRIEERSPSGARTALDVSLVVLVIGAVMAVAATAPSNTYAYAQLQQIGAVVGTIESGEWLLPRDQMGGLARKGQLYAWLDAPVLMATGIYNDFTFRLPTVVASFASAILVYFLGRRWYGRRVGLLAACLWATMLDMRNMAYIAITDMLVSLWILASIMCADKLLFHKAPPGKRLRWVIALWATMILGAMSKGWGVLNLILVGGALGLAVAVRPGFKALRRSENLGAELALLARLIGRRWWRAMKAVHFGWGMVAFVAAIVPVWIGMFVIGGEEFWEIVDYEFLRRVIGGGGRKPHSSSVPAILQLLYYGAPAAVMMILACLLVKSRRLFSRRGPLSLPLCFALAVVVPFSLPHAFRPDYLLPCYAAVALMAAWAVEEILRRGREGDRSVQFARHGIAAMPVLIGILLIVGSSIYLFHDHMPGFMAKILKLPSAVPATTWWILAGLAPLGVIVLALAVRWSLRWQLRRVAAVAVVAMLGMMFLDKNMVSRHARTRDGEKMIALARRAETFIGEDAFAIHRMEKLAVELYLGRFGTKIDTVDKLNASDAPWLLTCDRGLIELGATEVVSRGGKKVECLRPGDLGRVEAETEPVISQKWGRMYLIRLKRPIRVRGTPRGTPHESGRQ